MKKKWGEGTVEESLYHLLRLAESCNDEKLVDFVEEKLEEM